MSTATVDLTAEAQALAKELTGWRRELHRHPELGFEEDWTSAYLQKHLQGFDLELHPGIAKTGIAAVLRSPNSDGSAVLLRADMDALPIQEVGGRSYGSEIPGKMHACGHDGHMAMLLGAVRLIHRHRDRLPHDVVFCFQPAEEGFGGGQAMIEDGVLDLADIRSVFGLHLWSGFDTGTANVRIGPTMAANDEFTAVFKGRGGHGALPHTAVDPIVAAAHAVTALQSIVSRSVDPIETGVVTVGQFHAGTACNVIPETAELVGTIRAFTPDTQEIIRRRLGEVLEGSAAAMGCELDLDLRPGYPATVNDAAAVGTARTAATPVFGADRVLEPPPIAAAEDFSYFLQQRPGAFVFVGSRNEARGIVAPHHSPEFDLDEEALPLGCALLASLAFQPDAGRAEGSR